MGILHLGGVKPVLDIVLPDKLLEYYDKPQLLEDRIKEYTRANFADKKYVDSVNLNKFNWHDDLVKIVNKWIADQPKGYEIIDKWCSAINYALIKESLGFNTLKNDQYKVILTTHFQALSFKPLQLALHLIGE